MQNLVTQVNSFTASPVTLTGAAIGADQLSALAVQFAFTDATPAGQTSASTAVDPDTDTITKANHGMSTGLLGRFTTSTTLPAGLSAGTDYYVVRTGANTYKVSDTQEHALAGTNIVDITNAGTGNHTFTPTALGGSYKVQVSNGSGTAGWSDYAAATSFTAAVSKVVEPTVGGTEYRAVVTLTAGQITGYVILKGKG